MKRPAIFFDRDNTLIISDGYLGDPTAVRLIDGAANAVARARSLGFATITISNQSGVARGYFSEEAVVSVNMALDAALRAANRGAVIDRHEFCPFHPEATVAAYRQDSDLRKPRPGMILRAAEALALDLDRSWVIGDAPRDIAAGRAAGCRTVLVNNPAIQPSPAASDESDGPAGQADATVQSLDEALDFIEHAAMQSRRSDDPVRPVAPMSIAPAASPAAPAATASPPGGTSRPVIAATNLSNFDESSGVAATASARRDAPTAPAKPAPDLSRLEPLLEQVVAELRQGRDAQRSDFSVSQLLAGVVQMLAIAAFATAFFRSGQDEMASLLMAIFLQGLTIALLLMGR